MRRLGRFLFVPVDHPLRHALLRNPARSHPACPSGRRKRHDRWDDNRSAHSVSSGPGKVEAIRSVLMLKSSPDHRPDCGFGNAIWDREMLAMSKQPIRYQPQSRSEKDRDRQRLDGVSAGRQPRWAVARFDSIICWLFTPKVLMRVYYHPPTPLVVESWLRGSRRQNLEGEGLIFKIFRR